MPRQHSTARGTEQSTSESLQGSDAQQLRLVAQALKEQSGSERERLSDAALRLMRKKLHCPGASWPDIANEPRFARVMGRLPEALQDFISAEIARSYFD